MMNYSKTDHSFPRVAVVGCGAWGKNLVRNFAELGALAAVYDSDPFKAKDLASQYGLAAISEEEIFSHPSLDAIVISSIAPLHAFHAEQALKAGKHVYIEKPMALSVKDAQKLCSLAKTHNRLLMVGHILHYHPAFIALQERLPELGPLKHIYANRLALGRFRNQENVLWDLASHDISRIRPQLEAALIRVLDHGSYIMGPEVYELETQLSSFCGARHTLSCANGTDAIALVLMAKNVGPGDAIFVAS